MKITRHYSLLFRLVGIVLLIIIIIKIDIRETAALLGSAQLLPVFVAVITAPTSTLIKAYRWYWLVRSQNINLPVSTVMRIYFASYFLGVVTPARAGEFTRVYYLKKTNTCSGWKALSSVLVDRMLDVIVVVLLGFSGLVLWNLLDRFWTLLVVTVMIGLASIFLFSRTAAGFAFEKIFSRLPLLRGLLRKYGKSGGDFKSGIMSLTGKTMIVPVLITLLSYVIHFMQLSILAYALNIDIGYFDVVFVISSTMLISIIPITIAGIGTREAMLILLLGKLSVSAEQAVSYSLAIFVVFYILIALFSSVFHFTLPEWMKKPDKT